MFGILAVLLVAASGLDALPGRTLVPEVIDMGVTGRRSLGPGPAGAGGEDRPHAHLTLAITPAPTAHHYQHLQGGFVRSEPVDSRPHNEDELQNTRRKRAEEAAAPRPQDQEAAEDEVDDSEAAASAHPAARRGPEADDDMFLEPDAAAAPTDEPSPNVDTTGQPQNLFPAFQPLFPLGHSRPPIFQEPAFSQRQALLRPQYNAFHPLEARLENREPRLELPVNTFRERAYPQAASPAEIHSNALLGSGNFGVIHGGTFYGEEKDNDYEASPVHSFYGGNGHGRPAFYRGNPEPQRYRTAEDFFANFRDFADISTPTKSSFSEYYVVYVNRNASRDDAGTVVGPQGQAPAPRPQRPNNIMERLAEIDREQGQTQTQPPLPEVPNKKLSLGKRKLALLKKKSGKKAVVREVPQEAAQETQRDAHEPLLALS